MPNPHFDISVVKRSKGQSAVASAAYQSGDRLFSEYDQTYKDYRKKRGIIYTEIMLPANAPAEYAERETLWNAAEEVEKQWNAQLARRFELALPREVPDQLYPQMIKEYCQENFVSKGMCCDIAIHDPAPPGHNPHCHIMITMRAMDDSGKWLPKSRKVYDLDENGERIRLPSGNWKSHKENTVDWNEQSHGEEWRHSWEVVQNRYLEMSGRPERVDLRSYERQGLGVIPTVHMGPAVTQMEKRGIETNIGNLNRDIRAANRLMNTIRKTIRELSDWISKLRESRKEVLASLEEEASSPNLALLLNDYLRIRQMERRDWSKYGQQKGTAEDLKAVSKAIIFLNNHNLSTLENLDSALHEVSDRSKTVNSRMKKIENRMKTISGIQKAVAACRTHQEIHDKYLKIGWKTRQAAFASAHKDELDSFNKAYRYLKKHGVGLNIDLEDLRAECDSLQITHVDLAEQLAAVNKELKPLKDIRYWVGKSLDSKSDTIEKTPEPRHSVIERLHHTDEFKQKDTAAKQKEENIEH